MNIKPIKTEQDYDNALQRVDELMKINPALNTDLSDELEILVLLIEKYEEKHYKIEAPDPIEAIKIRMQEMNLKQKDLVPYIGSASKVSELLNRKISLSLNMVVNLAQALHLSFDMLLSNKIVKQTA